MLKFKLNILTATSLIALAMSIGSVESAQQRSRLGLGAQPTPTEQDQGGLPVPNYRFQAKQTYETLKEKADGGDDLAKRILEKYNGAAISTDLSAAKNAVTAYNNKDVSSLPTGASPSMARTAPITTPAPRSRTPIQGMAANSSRVKPNSSGDNKTEVDVPTNGLMAVRLYSQLKEKMDKGDKVAEQILKKYKSSDFQNVTIAAEAATAYNKATKEATERTHETVKSAETKTPSEVPVLKAELANAEAQASTLPEKKEEIIKAANHCISDVAKYEEEIKVLKKELEAAKHCPAAASKGKRDFAAEMEELVKKMETATDKKELELLNLKIGQLEREAAEAGTVLGEAAEKKAAAEEAKRLKELQAQERQTLKKAEEDKDSKAYETKGSWLPTLSTPKDLANYLNQSEDSLFGSFVNATQSLRIGGMIDQEANENVLRALRHMVRKFQGKANLSQKQKDELSVLANKIDLKLSSMGAAPKSQAAQGGNFTASQDDKRSYETFQFVWGEAQKDSTSKLFRSINNIKNTDTLITLITSSPDSLSNITFDAVKLRSISFSKATLLELKAFKYTLSQVRTSSFNPTAARELTQKIDDAISALQQGNVPANVQERTNDEQKIASRIKVTPAQRKQMMEEQKQADKAKINKLMPKESTEVQDYIFDQMDKNKIKIGELSDEQLKDKIEQFKNSFEKSKGEEALFATVSQILPDMAEKDRRNVLKKLLNLNFDFRTANTPEGKAKIMAEAQKITDLNERRKAMAEKTGAKPAGATLGAGDSILVRKHLKTLYPDKNPQEINSLFNKVASDMASQGLTGSAITEEQVKAVTAGR